MAHVVITGAASFVGLHFRERLIAKGSRMLGIDAFISYCPRAIKKRNLTGLAGEFCLYLCRSRSERRRALPRGSSWWTTVEWPYASAAEVVHYLGVER